MPPKKKTTAEATAGKKRAASPPASSAKKARTVAHCTTGPVKRSVLALEQLAIKKTKEEIWDHTTEFTRRTADSDFKADSMFKIATWNVAGLRGLLKKDADSIARLLQGEGLDVLCLQETKLNTDDAEANAKLGVVPGYTFHDHPCAVKKGYSGVRTYVKSTGVFAHDTTHVQGLALPGAAAAAAAASPSFVDDEGRVLTTFASPAPGQPSTLALVNTYVPNSGMDLSRLHHRTETFDASFRAYFKELDALCVANAAQQGGAAKAPVGAIWTGDLNVAERDYDRYYAGTFKTMQDCSGFTPEERHSFRATLRECDAVDTFRHLYDDAAPAYTFWSARINGRSKGLGWRLDYFVLPRRLVPHVVDCFPMQEVMGSDHCPVQLWLRKTAL